MKAINRKRTCQNGKCFNKLSDYYSKEKIVRMATWKLLFCLVFSWSVSSFFSSNDKEKKIVC